MNDKTKSKLQFLKLIFENIALLFEKFSSCKKKE